MAVPHAVWVRRVHRDQGALMEWMRELVWLFLLALYTAMPAALSLESFEDKFGSVPDGQWSAIGWMFVITCLLLFWGYIANWFGHYEEEDKDDEDEIETPTE